MRSTRPHPAPARSRVGRAVAATAALAACLALAGCGQDESEPTASGAEPIPVAQQPNGKEADPDTWPLTGLPVADGESASQRHPVLVLKMDNTGSSAPQVGLGSADLVVEELVEGGMTRLAALYHSRLPDDAGPVRSMRATDIGIVAPVEGDMVTSGAAGVTIDRVRKAGIDFFAEGAPGFYRSSSRSAPYNLFVDLAAVGDEAGQKASRPADYLPWGSADDLPQGQPASSLDATFSGGHTTSWSYRGGRYVNDNSYAADGDGFDADTVLVLRVPVGDAGYRDPAGNPVPETTLVGTGEAMVFHQGRLVRGTWSKKTLASPLDLTTAAGDLVVPAGRVWIELVPTSGGEVTFGG